MKKNIILSTLLLFLFSFSFSQQDESKSTFITWGEKLKPAAGSMLNGIIGSDETGFYVVKQHLKRIMSGKTNYTIEHYNHEMVLTKSFDLKLFKQDRMLLSVILFKDNLYIFSYSKDLEKNITQLYVQTANTNLLSYKDEPRRIAEFNPEFLAITSNYKSTLEMKNFHFKISEDDSKILIFYDFPTRNRKNKKFSFHVFDQELNIIWKKEVQTSFMTKLFDFKDIQVDEEGNAYLLGKLFNQKRKTSVKNSPNYKYLLMKYSDKGNNFNEYELSLGDKHITDMKISVDQNQNVICGGFYSLEYYIPGAKGCFSFKIDKNKPTIESKKIHEFGFDFIAKDLTKKEKDKITKKHKRNKNIEILNLRLKELKLKENGDFVLVGEQFYHKTISNVNNNSSTIHQYDYNNIVAINMSSEGDVKWKQKIAKRQFSQNDRGTFSSYALFEIDGKLRFIYNDHARNLHYKNDGDIELASIDRNSVVTMVSLDNEGIQSREALFYKHRADVKTVLSYSKKVSENELIMYGYDNTLYRFSKITFKE